VLAFAVGATLLPPVALSAIAGVAVSEIWSQHADSDRFLFSSGGAGLLETARLSVAFWRGAGLVAVPTAGLMAFASLFVWSAVLDAFCHDERLRPRDVASSSVVHVGRLAAVYGVFLLLRAATIWITIVLVQGVAPAVARDATERSQTLVAVAAGLAGLMLLELVRVLQDLTSVAAVRHEQSLVTTLITALGAFRDGFFALCARRAPFALASAALLVGATLGASAMWESAPAVLGRALCHGAALTGLLVLRAAWLRGLFAHLVRPPLTTQVDEAIDL